jgi:hypothetical protein
MEKMFQQVLLDIASRDTHRFLWRDSPDAPPKTYRMKRVTFGVSESVFLAIQTVIHHAQKYKSDFPMASTEITTNTYVDDTTTGTETETDAVTLRRDIQTLMQQGGFAYHKWVSNSHLVMQSIPEALRAPMTMVALGEPDLDDETPQKTLGVQWDPRADIICFKGFDFDAPVPLTKRQLSSIAAQVFDPMGLVSPVLIVAKLLLRDAWKHGDDWDHPVEDSIDKAFRQWCDDLRRLSEIQIPRWVGTCSEVIELQLHGFSDASEKAYAAAVYLRLTYKDGRRRVSLLTSKTRVAPTGKKIKTATDKETAPTPASETAPVPVPVPGTVTLVRLELLGALILSRLVRYVNETIEPSLKKLQKAQGQVVCWTDSTATLAWVRQPEKEWPTFIRNRVVEIDKNVTSTVWRHVPGVLNPADHPSRGLTAQELASCKEWLSGPDFLMRDQAQWPGQDDIPVPEVVQADLDKMKAKAKTLSIRKAKNEKAWVSPLNGTEFPTFDKFLFVVSIWLRFVKFLRTPKEERHKLKGPLTHAELTTAEFTLVLWAQKRHLSDDMDRVRFGDEPSRALKNLGPKINERGLLIVGGRLENAKLPEGMKHQVILPIKDELVEKLVLMYHLSLFHADRTTTLAALRLRYWLLTSRRELRRIFAKCYACRWTSTGPAQQIMAPLPLDRVQVSDAFTVVGIDVTGPFMVKRCAGAQGEDNLIKSWVILFTCATTRAVHLELMTDMTTDSFIAALQTMMNQRGRCRKVYSDNAPQFKRADKELRKLWSELDKDKVARQLGQAGKPIEWEFITPHAPWQGGFWERLMRSIKASLLPILGHGKITEQHMRNVIKGVEATLNSRPLTAILDDPDEPLPITPAHLVIGRPLIGLPDAHAHGKDVAIETKWKQRQKLDRIFWRRWQREYLPELTAHHKWTTPHPDIRVGDLVLVAEANRQRHDWPLGFVREVMKSRGDGRVRSAKVRIPGKDKLMTRPIQHLYLLEGTPVRPSVARGEGQPAAETAGADADAGSGLSDGPGPADSSSQDVHTA